MLTIDDFEMLGAAHAAARAPEEMFSAVESVLRARLGFGLLTMLKLEDDGQHVRRIFTTDPEHYPLSGTEQLGPTPWGEHVLRQAKPYLGHDKAGVEWAFPADYDLILSLGLGSTMNIPIVLLGQTLGSVNILDREGRYMEPHLKTACALAPYLVSSFLR